MTNLLLIAAALLGILGLLMPLAVRLAYRVPRITGQVRPEDLGLPGESACCCWMRATTGAAIAAPSLPCPVSPKIWDMVWTGCWDSPAWTRNGFLWWGVP